MMTVGNQIQKYSTELYEYMLDSSVKEHPALADLREKTAQMPSSRMQISADLGQLLSILLKTSRANRTLDIGTFTGYSALVAALALTSDGKVVTCDISSSNSDIATNAWEEANVSDRIELVVGPASETLQRLVDEGQKDTFDFAFIDADKANYSKYFDLCMILVRPGALIVIDDVLWEGKVVDKTARDKQIPQLLEFNKKLMNDNRVQLSMLPIGNGVTIAYKI